jgi:RNA polymerase sigma factor (sigma-70 family)
MPDEYLVLPPLPADPLFVDAVDDAVSGEVDLPEAQPERPVGADPRDFASLYIRHRSSFALHARRFLNDPRDVDEVLQEAFLRLFLAMPELETELQALAYCRRTVTNLCIDRYRADQRRPRLVDLEQVAWEGVDEATELDDPVLRAEDAAIVREALALLSPLHRAALIKREIEEKPLPQIAAELEIPEESVKHLLHRARRALRRLLVGTSVEPGVDLSNSEMLALANQRLARATLRGANVLIVLFVAAVTVVVGLRGTTTDDEEVGTGVLTPAVDQGVTGGAGNPAAPGVPSPRTAKPHGSDRGGAPAAPVAPGAQPTPAGPDHHEAAGPAREPVVTPPVTAPVDPADAGPAPGTFTIDAPVLGAVGTAAVQVSTVELKPSGDWANTSSFVAPVDSGEFALEQVVELSTEGVVSANLTPSLSTDSTRTYSSSVSTSASPDGNVVVSVDLLVLPQDSSTESATTSPPLDISVTALYTPDVTRVLAETVSVVEGSAPCCDSSATSTPPSQPSDSDTSSPSLGPAAMSFAAVSPLSPTRRNDQTASASS